MADHYDLIDIYAEFRFICLYLRIYPVLLPKPFRYDSHPPSRPPTETTIQTGPWIDQT